MKNEIYDNMLSAYGATTEQERRNAIFDGCFLWWYLSQNLSWTPTLQ